MSMVGQSESDDIFVSELKAKKLTITWSSVLLFLFQWENKHVDLITMGFLIFGIQIKISSDLLCPTILILPHPTLTIIENIWCLPKVISLHNDIISIVDSTDLSTLCLQRATLSPLELKVSPRYLKLSSAFIGSAYTVRKFTSDFSPLILRSLHLTMDSFSLFFL